MNPFEPYYDKIHVQLAENDGFLKTEGNSFEAKGLVISVGSDVKFVKAGDTLFFLEWGCWETVTDENGNKYHVVTDNSKFVLGKKSAPAVSKVIPRKNGRKK